jgi:glycosyltransferase involved in cell wall biosynthesis
MSSASLEASVDLEASRAPRFSVVIPTHQRRDLVVRAVQSLWRQDSAGGFEVIVVVDGSTDETGPALRSLSSPVPLRVLEQTNQGAASARTAGGRAARGEILLFLDDDMEADPGLLAAHDRAHRGGAAVVIGHMPLHPDSVAGVLACWVDQWVERRKQRLSQPGARVRATDLVGGQISVTRAAFLEVGGFDARLTERGTFGNEDMEFGYRLLQRGYPAEFVPDAVSWQRYVTSPRTFLRQGREAGRASVRFARLHPEAADLVFRRATNRRRYRWLAMVPTFVVPLRWIAVMIANRGVRGRIAERLFFAARAVEYCRGVREAGGRPRVRPLRVLAYHAIDDAHASERFAPYVIRPGEFRSHIETLLRAGYQFVSPAEAARFLRGEGGLPPRALLLTFDDCYAGVAEHALPVLEQYGIPGIAFAVADRVGETNAWVSGPPEARRSLLDLEGLERLRRGGITIGAHSRTHPVLTTLDAAGLHEEVAGACARLSALGLGEIQFFAYPFGEVDERVRRSVEEAGCVAAFTVEAGVVRPGTDAFLLPRIEILRGDAGWPLRRKVALGGALRRPRQGRREVIRTIWRRWIDPIARDAGARMLKPLVLE